MDVYQRYSENQPREVLKKSVFSQIGVQSMKERFEIEKLQVQNLWEASRPIKDARAQK